MKGRKACDHNHPDWRDFSSHIPSSLKTVSSDVGRPCSCRTIKNKKNGFQSPLKAGILTFGLNVVLFSVTLVCLYVPALIGFDMSLCLQWYSVRL